MVYEVIIKILIIIFYHRHTLDRDEKNISKRHFIDGKESDEDQNTNTKQS